MSPISAGYISLDSTFKLRYRRFGGLKKVSKIAQIISTYHDVDLMIFPSPGPFTESGSGVILNLLPFKTDTVPDPKH